MATRSRTTGHQRSGLRKAMAVAAILFIFAMAVVAIRRVGGQGDAARPTDDPESRGVSRNPQPAAVEPVVPQPMEPPPTEVGDTSLTGPPTQVEVYCVKCRDRRTISVFEKVRLANGRPAVQGHCPVCGTKVTRLVKTGQTPGT